MGRVTETSVFRVRLNELFATSGRRLTNQVVVDGMAEHGCRISTPYMSQLRSGVRNSPSDEIVAALAKYFGVSPEYFYTIPWDGDREAAYREDKKLIAELDDSGLQKLLSTANALSPESLDLLAEVATRLRAAEARHIGPAGSTTHVRAAES